MVFAAAEAVTDLRDKLTDAAAVAFTTACERVPSIDWLNGDTEPQNVHRGTHEDPASTREGRGKSRNLFADYLSDARQAWTPEVTITPAWVRAVTGCSRGLSSRLASTLTAEFHNDQGTEPEQRS